MFVVGSFVSVNYWLSPWHCIRIYVFGICIKETKNLSSKETEKLSSDARVNFNSSLWILLHCFLNSNEEPHFFGSLYNDHLFVLQKHKPWQMSQHVWLQCKLQKSKIKSCYLVIDDGSCGDFDIYWQTVVARIFRQNQLEIKLFKRWNTQIVRQEIRQFEIFKEIN